jgi:hypothetical protein
MNSFRQACSGLQDLPEAHKAIDWQGHPDDAVLPLRENIEIPACSGFLTGPLCAI